MSLQWKGLTESDDEKAYILVRTAGMGTIGSMERGQASMIVLAALRAAIVKIDALEQMVERLRLDASCPR